MVLKNTSTLSPLCNYSHKRINYVIVSLLFAGFLHAGDHKLLFSEGGSPSAWNCLLEITREELEVLKKQSTEDPQFKNLPIVEPDKTLKQGEKSVDQKESNSKKTYPKVLIMCAYSNCTHRGKSFSSISSLRRHEKSVHSKKLERKCSICGNKLSRPDALTVHMRTVHCKDKSY